MIFFKKKRNYIEWDQTNNMWHDGNICVYKNDKIVEHIPGLNADSKEEWINPYDLIEELKIKWNIKKLKEIKGPNWR